MVISNGDVLSRALEAIQGISAGGKADVKIATLFARHGKAYNLIKYASAVIEGAHAVPMDDNPVIPDYSSSAERPGPLEAVVGDMVRLANSCAGGGAASTLALDIAAANLQAWKAHLLGLRTAALYAERKAAPFSQPLVLRRQPHGGEIVLPMEEVFTVDEAVVLRRLLLIVCDAVRAYVSFSNGAKDNGEHLQPARIEDMHTYLAATAELVSPPSPIQTQLFGFFSDLLTLVLVTPLDNAHVFQWLSQHDVTDVATAWQQFEWISGQQLVKVALARAQQLLDTWEEWTGAQHNATILREMWNSVISARELAGPRPHASPGVGGMGMEERESPQLMADSVPRRVSTQGRMHGGASSPLALSSSSPQMQDDSPPNLRNVRRY